MKDSWLTQIMAKVDLFPSVSDTATELFSLLQDAEVEAAAIEKVLRKDPGLTANILKLTNSPYFGFTSRIGSIKQAVTLLGHQRLRQVVMVSCVSSIMGQPVAGYGLDGGELWRHSIAVSVAAEGLVKELKLAGPHEYFTAALLHDLGKLVLGGFVEENIGPLDRLSEEETPFELVEKKVLGIDHAEVGARLLEKWALPADIVDAVRWHHDPDAAPVPNRLTDIVHLADGLCLMAGIGIGREGLQYQLSAEATSRCGLNGWQIERVASGTIQAMESISGI